MWFVLYLPVLPDVPLDSDETELFIGSSWSWYRRVITHTHTHTHTHTTPSLAACLSRHGLAQDAQSGFCRWRRLIMQSRTQTCWISPAVFAPFIPFVAPEQLTLQQAPSQLFYSSPRLADWCFLAPVVARDWSIEKNKRKKGTIKNIFCRGLGRGDIMHTDVWLKAITHFFHSR